MSLAQWLKTECGVFQACGTFCAYLSGASREAAGWSAAWPLLVAAVLFQGAAVYQWSQQQEIRRD